MKDSTIVELYWHRNEAAITESARKYGSYCHTVSYNILQNREDAEECVNDTWLGAWNTMPPHRPTRLSVFLGKITRHLSLNRLKLQDAQKRGGGQVDLALVELEECIPAAADVESAVEDRLLADALSTFLKAQPTRRRNIFIRRYWYLFSVEEIAGIYGMSKGAVASLLFRMRAELKVHLEQDGLSL